jgi:epoxyqueuosine reductase
MEEQLLNKSIMVQDCIPKLDVDLVGVASLPELEGTKLAEMALNLLPETNSIVVFAMEVFQEALNLTRPERAMGQASLNDLLDRHQEYLNGRLNRAAYDLAKVSHRNSLKALPLPAVGTPTDFRFLKSVFSYKHAAQAAGLGYIGRSSLLITPLFGPRVRLACCLTEAVLKPQRVEKNDLCSGCNVCIASCPAGVLSSPQADEPYVINKFACSAFRIASGGCSECVIHCPAGS